jgi:hypothetical protein
MRKLSAFAAVAIALASCSQQSDERTASEEMAAPDIQPSAAPGVAFRFSYDYSLDDDRISAVQEAHASACEKLGLAKCRITGLTFNIDNKKRVSGMLQVKLEPAIARQFGKQATATVALNDGDLVRSEFSGEDVGTQIGTGEDQQADLQNRIAEMEKRLASLKAGDREATQCRRSWRICVANLPPFEARSSKAGDSWPTHR